MMGNSQQALHSSWYLELRCWKEGLFVEEESQDPGSTRVLVSWATLLQMARFPNRQQAFPQEIPWSWS